MSLHCRCNPEKTRLIEFGRFAAERRKRRGLGKPETFNFLGFTFVCGKSRSGQIPNSTENPAGPHAGKATGGQGNAATVHAPADPRAGAFSRLGQFIAV
jgi:hypothetical protein